MLLALHASLALSIAASATPASATSTPAPSSYSGHGAASVSAETLARFRAPPLPAEVTRRVQALLDVRTPSAGTLSPDGKRLFFSWSVTGVRQLWRLDGPMAFPVQLTGGEDVAQLFDITPDGKTLVVMRDRKGEENPGIYLMSPDGGPLTVVQHKPQVQTQPLLITPDGALLYFRANDERPDAYTVYRYRFATRAIERVFGGDALWNVADRTPNGKLLVVKEVGSNQAELFEFDEATGALEPLFGQGEREDYVAAYGRDDDILVLTPRFGEQRRLYRFERQGRTFSPVTPALAWDVETFSVDEKKTRILVGVNEGGYARLRAFDAALPKKPLAPEDTRGMARALRAPKLPEGDLVAFGPTTPDGRFTTLSIDQGVAPATNRVLDWRTGKLTTWNVPSAPEVDLDAFVRALLEDYPARDGTKIPMLVRRPAACATAPTPCPVIIEFHGGPEGQSRPGFSPRAQLFVNAGFIHVQPNVRGSDGYGKTWIHADDGPKRKAVITDIEDVALFVKKAWAKDGKVPRVGIMGGSYGGYSSLMGMTYFAGAYDAGIEIVGISSLVTFLENTAPYRRALRISEYGDPVKDRDVLVELSPVTHAHKARGPMLLIQGATDPRVPVGEAVQMYDALDTKGLNPKMIVFPDEGHGVQKRENLVVVLGHALAFFEEHLQGRAAGGGER